MVRRSYHPPKKRWFGDYNRIPGSCNGLAAGDFIVLAAPVAVGIAFLCMVLEVIR